MPKSYHHGDLRAALIEETLRMIERDEMHLIGFRELARRLDVSRSAPYRHFESVDGLLAVVAEEGFQVFVATLERITQMGSVTDGDRFVELGIAYVNFALERPAYYRLLFDRRFFVGDEYSAIQTLASKAFHLLKQTSSACIASDASSDDKTALANLAWACVHGLSSLLMNGQLQGVKNRERFIRDSCRNLLRIAVY